MTPDLKWVLDHFPRPWKIKRHSSGSLRVEDAKGKVLIWAYVKRKDAVFEYTLLDDEEALHIARAFAALSKEEEA